jgi:hypothetical protein
MPEAPSPVHALHAAPEPPWSSNRAREPQHLGKADPGSGSGACLQMRLDYLYGARHAIFSPYAPANLLGTGAHFVAARHLDEGIRQPLGREPPRRDRLRACPQLVHAPTPERLIARKGNGDVRHASLQTGARRASPAMMHHSRHSGEQPAIGRSFQRQDPPGKVFRIPSRPDQHASQATCSQCTSYRLNELAPIAGRGAPKTDRYRSRIRIQKVNEFARGLPLAKIVQEPVSRYMCIAGPVPRRRDHSRTEGIKQRRSSLILSTERPAREGW